MFSTWKEYKNPSCPKSSGRPHKARWGRSKTNLKAHKLELEGLTRFFSKLQELSMAFHHHMGYWLMFCCLWQELLVYKLSLLKIEEHPSQTGPEWANWAICKIPKHMEVIGDNFTKVFWAQGGTSACYFHRAPRCEFIFSHCLRV